MAFRTSYARRLLAIGALLVLSAPAMSQVIFTDDFESCDTSKAQNGVKWKASPSTSVTSKIAHSGRCSLQFFFKAGAEGFSEQRFDLGKDYKEVQVQWYAYYPDGTEGLGARFQRTEVWGNNKFIRIWKGDKADGSDGYASQWLKVGASGYGSLLRSGDESVGAELGTDTKATGRYDLASKDPVVDDTVRGKWTKFRFVVRASSATGKNDGLIELYRNDQLSFSSKNVAAYASNGTTPAFNFGYLLGHANSGFAQDTYVFYDDIQISTSSVVSPNPPTGVTVQ